LPDLSEAIVSSLTLWRNKRPHRPGDRIPIRVYDAMESNSAPYLPREVAASLNARHADRVIKKV
jgi:hypothetical protein